MFASSTSKAATSPPPICGIEPLRHHRHQRTGELHLDLRLTLGREHVGHAVERLRGVVRVQGGEHEVAGLGERQRELNRLGVSHLADQDDVGVFTKRRAQRALERVRVGADLTLVHRRLLVRVHVFDRILDREDVHLALAG